MSEFITKIKTNFNYSIKTNLWKYSGAVNTVNAVNT